MAYYADTLQTYAVRASVGMQTLRRTWDTCILLPSPCSYWLAERESGVQPLNECHWTYLDPALTLVAIRKVSFPLIHSLLLTFCSSDMA